MAAAVILATVTVVAQPGRAVTGAFALERRFVAPVPASFGAYGREIALAGARLAVLDNVSNPDFTTSRVIRLFHRDATGWVADPSIDVGAAYVADLDLLGTRLAVGMPYDGGVRIYDVSSSSAPVPIPWPATPAGPSTFGESVALDGDRLIVGDDGADRAYVFRYTTSWTLEGILSGTTSWFGRTVDISGDYAVVPNGTTAFMFRWTGSQWVSDGSFTPPNLEQPDVDSGVRLAGGTLAVTVGQFDSSDDDRLYILTRAGSWSLAQDITLPFEEKEAAFDGSTIVVLDRDGIVHEYQRAASTWVEGPSTTLVTGDVGGIYDPYYGAEIAVSGDRFVTGVPAAAPNNTYQAGAAYVYGRDAVSAGSPGAPANVTAVPGAGGTVMLSWTAPENDGGSALIQYQVTATAQGPWPQGGGSMTVAAPATTAVFTGLVEFEDYRFTVVATNGFGAGPASDPSNVVVVPGPPSVPSPFTVTDASGEGGDPLTDLLSLTIDYVDDEITVSARTASPEDPHSGTLWPVDGAHLFFHFRPPAHSHNLLYQHQNTNGSPYKLPGEDVIARFEFQDDCGGGSQLWPGRFVNGAYQATFPAACVGSPPSVRVSASMYALRGHPSDALALSPPVRRRSAYTALTPARLVDTRASGGVEPGADTVLTLPVAGRGGVPVGAAAAVLNVTGADASADGYVTVYPCDEPRPDASNLNLRRDATVPNLVITKLAADGSVCLFTSGGTHLIADVSGYFPG